MDTDSHATSRVTPAAAAATEAIPEADTESPEIPRNIVIIGGGVIGSTTAYFLTRHPKYNPTRDKITLLEATTIAAGASGKAGGLLALWAYPKELVDLSYRLHRELAAEHNGAELWGYRTLTGCGSISANVTRDDLSKPLPPKGPRSENVHPVANGQGADGGYGKDTTNGNGAVPLPIHSQAAELEPSTTELGKAENADNAKEWEKLPKQDLNAASQLKESVLPPDLDWINKDLVYDYSEMGRHGATETSQVHPFHFTTNIARLAAEKGVDIRVGCKATRIISDKYMGVQRVEYLDRGTDTEHMLNDVTDVIVTAGPWTGGLIPKSQIEGLRAHSVVWSADVSAYAVFTDIGLPHDYVPEHREKMGQKRKHKGNVDPEIYARPFGEVYACGEPDSTIPLPATADLVACDKAQCNDIAAYTATISPVLAAAPIKQRQACYLPRHLRFGDERGPLIGPTASTPGLWIASGHTCWGIQNGPATGCVMAEMVWEGEATSADVDKFDPGRYKV